MIVFILGKIRMLMQRYRAGYKRQQIKPTLAENEGLSNAEKIDDSSCSIILIGWTHSVSFSKSLEIICCLLLVSALRYALFLQRWKNGSKNGSEP